MADTAFRQLLADTLRDSFATLKRISAGERLYAFAVFSNGETNYDYLAVTANTEEGLERRVEAALAERPDSDFSTVARELRWSTLDWAYHDFFESMGDLALPTGEGEKRDARIHADILAALKGLDDTGLFGSGPARNRTTLLVVCGDMSPEYFQKGLKKLNPPAVVKAYLAEYSPDRMYARLDQMPSEQRLGAYLGLYAALALHQDNLLTREAKQCGLDSHLALHPVLAKLAPNIVTGLLALIERHVGAKAFNLERSAAWKRDGTFTAEIRLASAAVQLLADCGNLTQAEVGWLQRLLVQRLDFDADTSGPVSTLPEDIANTLHDLYPGRFPAPQKSATTNRLLNAKAFH